MVRGMVIFQDGLAATDLRGPRPRRYRTFWRVVEPVPRRVRNFRRVVCGTFWVRRRVVGGVSMMGGVRVVWMTSWGLNPVSMEAKRTPSWAVAVSLDAWSKKPWFAVPVSQDLTAAVASNSTQTGEVAVEGWIREMVPR